MVIDVIGLISANPATGSGQSLAHKTGNTLYNASSSEIGATSVTMSWTHSEEDWGIVAAPLKASTALLVELIQFFAKPHNYNQIELIWATSDEVNNAFFTIESSKDGIDWKEIAIVESIGNKNTAAHYSKYDNNPYRGDSYYRLKQTDYDGTYQYFEKVAVYLEEPENDTPIQ